MKIVRVLVLISSIGVMASTMNGCGPADSLSENASENVLLDTSDDTSLSETTETIEAIVSVEYIGRHALSNENADEITQRVYDYVCDNYGEYMLSSQQESTWKGSPDYEMDYILETTGKLPAMRGLDFMNGDFNGVVERSKAWWEEGGLVTICWHTGINGKGYQESKDDVPDFDRLLTEGTPEYEAMINNWDKAAVALSELKDAGVPVLWRPFHEFDGGWFWWGKDGGENFIKLWQMMYDRYTNKFDLTNLIWVLGYSGEVKDGWYPGDEYCDIIGSDTYDNSTHLKAWNKLQKVTDSNKPRTFHECGNVPPVEDFEKDGCLWSWFMIWHTDHIKGNNTENLIEVYQSDKVITLDELPDFSIFSADEVDRDSIDNAVSEELSNTVDQESNEETSYMEQYKDQIVEMPPKEIEDMQDGVIYSEFKKHTYYSTTAERDTNVNVLLPPDYSEDKEYPVLYILHGYWDNEDWMTRPVVSISTMLSNLYARGEAEEMIVVAPYIYCSKDMPHCTGMDLTNSLNYDNFINDLSTDLMPFIENSFSVAKGRENTALTGFSMGGRESFFIGFSHPELFGYIGAICPAPGLTPVVNSSKHPGQMEEAELVFKENSPYILLLSAAKNDGVVGSFPSSYQNLLTKNETEHIWHVMLETGHDHSSVKPHLYNFMRVIFKVDK